MELINKLTEQQKADFWNLVDKSAGEDKCWPYTGPIATDGYGKKGYRIDNKLKHYKAHRLALIFHTGQCPEGLLALHAPVICNNKKCCNVNKHLRWGTYSENALDKNQDGTQSKNCKPQIGEKNGRAILNEEKVREIRKLLSEHKLYNDIAQQFGVSKSAINNIARGVLWKHVI